MLVDTHTHLNFKAYDKDRAEVIDRCQDMKLINIGTVLETSKKAVALALENDNFYASIKNTGRVQENTAARIYWKIKQMKWFCFYITPRFDN